MIVYLGLLFEIWTHIIVCKLLVFDKNSCYHITIVMWYAIRERVKESSIPLPLYLNQQALRLTIKMVGKRRSSYLHSVPYNLLNKRSLGQSSGMTWWGGGRGKVGWLVHKLFAPKRLTCFREIWRRILVWIKPASEADCWGQPAPGKTLTHKKKRKKSEDWEPVKDKYNSNRFPSTILKYWTVICIKKKRETIKVLFHQ